MIKQKQSIQRTKPAVHVLFTAVLVLLAAVCIFAGAGAADDPVPTLPFQVYGSVIDPDGAGFPAGTVITATVDGITSSFTVKEAGKIGGPGTFDEKFLIYGTTNGSPISFKIGTVSAEAVGGCTFISGDSKQITLIIAGSIPPTQKYTVTYDGNGADSGSVPVDSAAYTRGSIVTVSGNTGSLAKTDYTFLGWNSKADGTGNSYSAGDTFTISKDVTLYAVWEYTGVQSVVSIDPVKISALPLNLEFDELGLPEVLTVTTNLGAKRSLPVVWDSSSYDKTLIGAQTINGTLQLPEKYETLVEPVATIILSDRYVGIADIVFIIDTTGSMSDEINNVVKNLKTFTDEIDERGVSTRWALIEYRDITCDGNASTKLHPSSKGNWYTDVSELQNSISALRNVGGGGDTPETVIDGLETGRRLDMRDDAARFFITITDANWKVNNQYGITGMPEMISKLVEGEVHTSVITAPRYYSDYTSLTTTTDGILANIYGNFADELLKLCDLISIVIDGRNVAELVITTPPAKTIYTEGELFDKTGMVVTLKFEGGAASRVTTAYTVTPAGTLTTADTKVTVSFGKVSADVPVTVNPAPVTYTVTYDANDADSGDVPVDNNRYASNAEATVLGNTGSLVRAGYTFSGWKAGGTGAVYTAGDTFPVTGNTILYAKWEANVPAVVYTVTYNANGADSGAVPADELVYNAGDIASVYGNVNGLAKAGYTFSGWNTSAAGTGIPYKAGDTITISGNVVLYAQWTETVVYTVTFNSNGGSEVPPAEVESGSIVAKPKAPVKDGYNFGGWYVDTGCTTGYDFSTPVTSSFTLYAKWDLIKPVAEAPVITADPLDNGFFETRTTVTIKCGTEEASVYYTTDGTSAASEGGSRILYSGPITVTDTTTIRAVSVKDGYTDSPETTLVVKKTTALPKNRITIIPSVGGTLTADKTENVEYGTTVTITAVTDENYSFTSWTIMGASSGKTVTKPGTVTGFAMWDEPVIITSVFTQTIDPTPKPASLKINNIPKTLYVDDTGKLDASVYDQFGKLYTEKAVTWVSDAPGVVTISTDGKYTCKTGGSAKITASCGTISETFTLVVYLAPNPRITLIDNPPKTAYVGILSDPVKVDTENTASLTWDWGDTSEPVTRQVNYPYPKWNTSIDTDSHTYTAANTYTVSITPANKYTKGEPESISITVDYAPPRNVKIVDGPSAVIAGDICYYTAFATGADAYRWYFDGTLLSSAGSANSAVITIPDNISGKHTVKVVAWAGGTEPTGTNSDFAEKEIEVSVKGGVLGGFGSTIKQMPEKTAVGVLSLFSIDAVDNAVRYTWTFGDETVSSTSPSVAYALKDTVTNSVSVTAYNSAGTASEAKVYTITPAGEKPTVTGLTADCGTSAEAGTTVIYTVSASGASSYKWIVDGTVQTETGSSITKHWTDADVKLHEIVVYAVNDYGDSRKSMTFTVTPHSYAPAVIEGIDGPAVISDKHKAEYTAFISSKDEYTTAWYLNNVLLDKSYVSHNGMQIMLKGKDLEAGEYVIRLIVTTVHEEVSEFEKTIVRTADDTYTKNKADAAKAVPKDNEKENLKLTDAGKEKSVMHLVGTVTVSDEDINQEAEDVYVEVEPVAENELVGFTDEMGNPSDVVLALDITPHGLKNEKNLEKSAVIILPIPKSSVANASTQRFYRLDTGSVPEKWVRVTVQGWEEVENDYVFTLLTSGFSKFVSTTIALDEGAAPETPEYTVSFNVQGHGVAPLSQTVKEGETVTEPTNPVASGYVFCGWYLETGCINRYDFSSTVSEAFVLYAKWVEESSQPVFNAVTKAKITKSVAPAELSTLTVPQFTNIKSGKSILLDDESVVHKIVGGADTGIIASYIEGGQVRLVNPSDAEGADSLSVEFVGRVLGDVNGDGIVDVFDAAAAARYGVKLISLSDDEIFYGDINGDGIVDVFDAALAARYGVKLLDADFNEK